MRALFGMRGGIATGLEDGSRLFDSIADGVQALATEARHRRANLLAKCAPAH